MRFAAPLIIAVGFSSVSAQTTFLRDIDTLQLFDLFPLAIGNQWTYEYFTGQSYEMGITSDCYGTEHFVIVDSIRTADSTLWFFNLIRDFECETCDPFNGCGYHTYNDSIPFLSVERLFGSHQLFIPGAGVLSVFPFFEFGPDTNELIYRYYPSQSRVVDRPCRIWPGGHLEFQEHQGELSYDFYCSNDFGGYDAAHHDLLSSVINSVNPVDPLVLPEKFGLLQNYPNPFNPTTTFQFSLRSSVFANLSVYDILGRRVATIVNEKLAPGVYTRQWDATGFSGGVYLYRLQTGGLVETRKLLYLK